MSASRDIGLYVHIPFCRQRCHFCAFYLEVARAERIEAFCGALDQEILLSGLQDLVAGRPLTSIYLGGGTPTAIPIHRLTALLARIRALWTMKPDVEVTVEAHPTTVSAEDLRSLVDAGVNRISLGAESMNADDFRAIGRPGTVGDTETAVLRARAAGFTNINLDLMYGLPGQTCDSWARTLEAAIALDPSHVSCYALTIEEGTKLAHDVARNMVMPADESAQIDMELTAEAILGSAGFTRYEISNYARPGAACRHNLLYWTDQDYLGLGPSAQSYVQGVRFGDLADLTTYVDLLGKGMLPVSERIQLSPSQQHRDALVFGLRLIEGVPQSLIETGLATTQAPAVLDQLTAQGLIEFRANRVRLTPLGQRYADTVAGALF